MAHSPHGPIEGLSGLSICRALKWCLFPNDPRFPLAQKILVFQKGSLGPWLKALSPNMETKRLRFAFGFLLNMRQKEAMLGNKHCAIPNANHDMSAARSPLNLATHLHKDATALWDVLTQNFLNSKSVSHCLSTTLGPQGLMAHRPVTYAAARTETACRW